MEVTWVPIFFQFLMYLKLVTPEATPIISQTCNLDCTLAENLPCKISSFASICLLDDYYSPTLWPGPPDDFKIMSTYEMMDGKCMARLKFQWTVPNDSSGKAVRGFELNIMSLSGTYTDQSVCTVFDLSKAEWTDNDITSRRPYFFDCVLVSPGKYGTSIYSLPKPNMGAIDKRRFTDFTIPEADVVNGTCVVSTQVSSTRQPNPVTTSKPESLSTQSPVQAVQHNTNQKMQWLGVGIGIAVGILAVLLLILTRCGKQWNCKTKTENPDRTVLLDTDEEDFDSYRPPSPTTTSGPVTGYHYPVLDDSTLRQDPPLYTERPCYGDGRPTMVSGNDTGVNMLEYCPNHQAQYVQAARQTAFKAPESLDGRSSICASEEAWRINNQNQATRNMDPHIPLHSRPNPMHVTRSGSCLVPPRDMDCQSDKMSEVVWGLNQPSKPRTPLRC